MNDNVEVKKDNGALMGIGVIAVIVILMFVGFAVVDAHYNKEFKKMETEGAYKDDNFKKFSNGEFLSFCGLQQAYYDTTNNVIWIMSNGESQQAFVLYNIDGTLRTYDGNDEFPLVEAEHLGRYMYIYYDKVTHIKYLVNRSINFGTPMLNSDGTYSLMNFK